MGRPTTPTRRQAAERRSLPIWFLIADQQCRTHRTGRVECHVLRSSRAFHSLKEYQRGDPAGRIDWRRYAKTGTAATKRFHDDRHSSVVVVLDVLLRQASTDGSNRHPPTGSTHQFRLAKAVRTASRWLDATGTASIDRIVELTRRIAPTALEAGTQVGIELLADKPVVGVPIGNGRVHRERIERFLSMEPTLEYRAVGRETVTDSVDAIMGSSEMDPAGATRRIRGRLSPAVQMTVVSPLTDDFIVEVSTRLAACSRSVVIVSPDPTRREQSVRGLAHVARRLRISRLRGGGVPVIDVGASDEISMHVRSLERVIR